MAITVSGTTMTSDRTRHSARRIRNYNGTGFWRVSWCPGFHFSEAQAEKALWIAELAAEGFSEGDPRWDDADDAAGQIYMPLPDALERAQQDP